MWWLCTQQINQVIIYFHNIPWRYQVTEQKGHLSHHTFYTSHILWSRSVFLQGRHGTSTEKGEGTVVLETVHFWNGVPFHVDFVFCLFVFCFFYQNACRVVSTVPTVVWISCLQPLTVQCKNLCFSFNHRYSKIGKNTCDTAALSILCYHRLTLTTNDNDNPLTDGWSWDHIQWMQQTRVKSHIHPLLATLSQRGNEHVAAQ